MPRRAGSAGERPDLTPSNDAPPDDDSPGRPDQNPEQARGSRRGSRDDDLERFVSASGENRRVLAAMKRFCREPASLPAPVLLIGPRRSGKTHLFHAAARALRRRPGQELRWLDAARWTRRVQAAHRRQALSALEAEYDVVSTLLIDDVDQLAGRPASQRALVAVLDALHARGGQALLTATSPDGERLEPALAERLGAGLRLELDPASVVSRRLLLGRALLREGVALAPQLSERAAAAIEDPARLSLLARLLARVSGGRPPTRAHLDATLRQLGPCHPTAIPAIVARVAERHGLEPAALCTRTGPRQRAHARRLALCLAARAGHAQAALALAFTMQPASVSVALGRARRLGPDFEAELEALAAELGIR